MGVHFQYPPPPLVLYHALLLLSALTSHPEARAIKPTNSRPHLPEPHPVSHSTNRSHTHSLLARQLGHYPLEDRKQTEMAPPVLPGCMKRIGAPT